jgi:hypothetical protein
MGTSLVHAKPVTSDFVLAPIIFQRRSVVHDGIGRPISVVIGSS